MVPDSGGPYETLLGVLVTYCHPSAWEGAYGQLRAIANRADDVEMRVFKRQLVAVIRDPSRLPEGALLVVAEFDDGSEGAFLARLWRDLYPDEPMPVPVPAERRCTCQRR